MKLGYLACAFGKHRVDMAQVRHIHGGQVGRCKCCSVPLEEASPGEWMPQMVHDAGLGYRRIG